MSNQKKPISARNLAVSAMLSAVAFILMYLEIAVPVIPSFIKFDFSDLPALLGAFSLGPVYGVIICLVKNILHMAFSNTMFVGELSNFILGSIFVFTAGLIYKSKKSKKTALLGGIAGAVAMGLFSIISNYYVVYPVYYNLMPKEAIIGAYSAISMSIAHVPMTSIMQCLICFNLPFTIVKGLISVAITMLVYKPLAPFLKGK